MAGGRREEQEEGGEENMIGHITPASFQSLFNSSKHFKDNVSGEKISGKGERYDGEEQVTEDFTSDLFHGRVTPDVQMGRGQTIQCMIRFKS